MFLLQRNFSYQNNDLNFQVYKRLPKANFNHFARIISLRLTFKVAEKKNNMKIIIGLLCLYFVNISAEKPIIGEVPIGNPYICEYYNVKIEANETVAVYSAPSSADVKKVYTVVFLESSIYSVPSEIFTKFPNLEDFRAKGQNIQEIKPNTFKNARNLKLITLSGNELTYLHRDIFQGEFFDDNRRVSKIIIG
jgi:hypothetical protein